MRPPYHLPSHLSPRSINFSVFSSPVVKVATCPRHNSGSVGVFPVSDRGSADRGLTDSNVWVYWRGRESDRKRGRTGDGQYFCWLRGRSGIRWTRGRNHEANDSPWERRRRVLSPRQIPTSVTACRGRKFDRDRGTGAVRFVHTPAPPFRVFMQMRAC